MRLAASHVFPPAGVVDEAQDNAALRRCRLRRLLETGVFEQRGDLGADDAAPLEQPARHRDQRRPVSLEQVMAGAVCLGELDA